MAKNVPSLQRTSPSLIISSVSGVTSRSGLSFSHGIKDKHGHDAVGGEGGVHSTAPTSDSEQEDGSRVEAGKDHPSDRRSFSLKVRRWFRPKGKLRPFRLLRQDINNIQSRYISDWTLFNQLVFASAVYVFFTNLLPGITFASDLYVLTGHTWGTIEVVFSTGLCGLIFSVLVYLFSGLLEDC